MRPRHLEGVLQREHVVGRQQPRELGDEARRVGVHSARVGDEGRLGRSEAIAGKKESFLG